jgi:hypothetical protein
VLSGNLCTVSVRSGGRGNERRNFMKSVSKFRRLTKAEAKRLGVSHTAKRRVDASLKRVTKSTKLYTDRQVAELRTGVKREAYTKSRFETRALKKGGHSRVYKNLSRADLMARLKKEKKDTDIVLYAEGNNSGADYQAEKGKVWSSVANTTVENVNGEPSYLDRLLERRGITNAKQFAVVLREDRFK